MSTIYSVAASLDGFVAGPDDDLDWLLQFGFDAFREHHDRFTAGVGALAMGATTYEWLRGHDDAWPYPDTVTWVFSSRSLDVPADGDVRVVTGDVRGHHGLVMASAGGRDLWIVGGGVLAAQYQQAGLLDELHVTVMPIALGAGTPLLPVEAGTGALDLVGTTAFDGGAIELRYRTSTPG
ncbi:dihydrofolate reductase family protein [Curtobacterium sp. MCBD17_008]|uniref:dihydrofolate reductase family protein n=1 Tax=Curtobacterium sp. MCBD17_008 TaxID=2175656 RepID=UPI000DA801F9|nr:dihydrofolate reductase family protein [Curtobacterium sp. MCBD17_008]PZE94754.1 dihydrofolate reductase [Curtobacterium sp. MCBD17_008]